MIIVVVEFWMSFMVDVILNNWFFVMVNMSHNWDIVRVFVVAKVMV